MRHVFVSPHIDDAFLSSGGLIMHLLSTKQSVSIEYVFTVTEWTNASSISTLAYPNDRYIITAIRKQEEENLNSSLALGYEFRFYDFLDEPLRQHCNKSEEKYLIDDVTKALLNRIEKNDFVYFPLGLFHGDHVMIRNIGYTLLNLGYQIIFYEDMPYIASGYYNLIELYNRISTSGLIPNCREFDIQEKEKKIKYYESQVSAEWLFQINHYSYSPTTNCHYERFWSVDSNIFGQLSII